MDVYDLPATVLSCLIASVYFGWGYSRGKREERTGDISGENLYLAAIIIPGGVMYYFGIDHPFWGDVVMNLTGMLMGFGAAYYGFLAIRRLLFPTR